MQTHHFISRTARAATLLLAMALGACGGEGPGNQQARTAAATVVAVDATQVAVTGISKTGETRVGRTVFDYVFQVSFKNNGSEALSDVSATLTAVGAGATIVDGTVLFSSIGAGASVTPADSITIRQDRSVPFNPAALVWTITASSTPPAVPGIVLPGAPGASAVDAIPEYEAARTAADLAIAADGGGNMTFYRTQLQAVIAPNATVGQVNAGLASAGARLVWSMRKNRVVTLQVPDPGSLEALDRIAAALASQPGFDSVSVYFLPVPSALPPNVSPEQAVDSMGPLLNHVGARLPAAWNARAALASGAEPEVLVIDYFGQGTPTQLVAPTSAVWSNAPECAGPHQDGNPCEHGYHVIGILAGSFGGSPDDPGRVTGSLARPLPLTVIDLSTDPSGPPKMWWDEMRKNIAARFLARPEGKFVLNFSLQYCRVPQNCRDAERAPADAFAWRAWARGIYRTDVSGFFDWDSKVFTVSAAGNTSRDGRVASLWNAAALLPPMVSPGDNSRLMPLANSLVVEARDTQVDTAAVFPTCRVAYSNFNGDVAAIGGGVNRVFSFISPTAIGRKNGTSMASPQVAGLVASMIAVRPQAPLSDIKLRIEAIRTRQENCPGNAPMIDAYAAMLALDQSYTEAPVRTALLKPMAASVGAGEQFTYDDARAFLRQFFPLHYGQEDRRAKMDFSRYDLNGDGFAGGLLPAAFPLRFSADATPFAPATIDVYPSGMALVTPIAESGVTDFEILCYYVNSPLMAAGERARFDGELARISAERPNDPRIACVERVVTLQVNDSNPGWTGLPAVITLSTFSDVFPATAAGNSPTCTNQGQPAGERGAPLFSGAVLPGVSIRGAIDVVGVPTPVGNGSNRRNCSSFYATDGEHSWINATARAVFGFGTGFVSDWEFQVRYASGDRNGVGKKCTVGTVPNSNNFAPAFEAASCSHTDSIKGKISQ